VLQDEQQLTVGTHWRTKSKVNYFVSIWDTLTYLVDEQRTLLRQNIHDTGLTTLCIPRLNIRRLLYFSAEPKHVWLLALCVAMLCAWHDIPNTDARSALKLTSLLTPLLTPLKIIGKKIQSVVQIKFINITLPEVPRMAGECCNGLTSIFFWLFKSYIVQ